MKLTLKENSLFGILLRSPWWASALGAAAAFGVTRLFMPPEFALFAASPFLVIMVYVVWKQLRAPSARHIAARLERLRAMPWDEFAEAIERVHDPLSWRAEIGRQWGRRRTKVAFALILALPVILVIAFAHTARRPGYWRRRLKSGT